MRTGMLPAILLFLLRIPLISALVLSVPNEIILDQGFTFSWTRGSAEPAAVVLWPVSDNGSDTPVVHQTDYYLDMSSQFSGSATWQFNSTNSSMQPGSYLIYALPSNNEPPSGNTLAASMLGLSNQFILNGSQACSPGLDTCTTTTTTSIVPSSSETMPPPSFNTPSQGPSSSTPKAGLSGTMIGVILGSALALLFLIVLIIYLLLRRKRRRNDLSVEDNRTDPYYKLESESKRAMSRSPSVNSSHAATRQELPGANKASRVPSTLERTWWDEAP